ERVGLSQHAAKYPGQLSGGQQQRGGLARALALGPLALLFYEPPPALGPGMIKEGVDVITEPARGGLTLVGGPPQVGVGSPVAHRVIFMDHGRIVEDDKKEDFFGTPRSERARQFLSKILHH